MKKSICNNLKSWKLSILRNLDLFFLNNFVTKWCIDKNEDAYLNLRGSICIWCEEKLIVIFLYLMSSFSCKKNFNAIYSFTYILSCMQILEYHISKPYLLMRLILRIIYFWIILKLYYYPSSFWNKKILMQVSNSNLIFFVELQIMYPLWHLK